MSSAFSLAHQRTQCHLPRAGQESDPSEYILVASVASCYRVPIVTYWKLVLEERQYLVVRGYRAWRSNWEDIMIN